MNEVSEVLGVCFRACVNFSICEILYIYKKSPQKPQKPQKKKIGRISGRKSVLRASTWRARIAPNYAARARVMTADAARQCPSGVVAATHVAPTTAPASAALCVANRGVWG